MENFLAVLYGIVFGVANIIPGVSGGTMLVVFGCYDKVCGALSMNLKEIRKNIVFLLFFGAGAVIGIVGFSFVITWLFGRFPTQTYMLFIGLIIGSVPLIIRNATAREKFRPICAVPFAVSLALVIGLSLLEQGGVVLDAGGSEGIGFFARIMAASFVAAVAMIIPGVSGSFIMVLFGTYTTVIGAIKQLDIITLIPAAVGILFGIVLGARLITALLKRYRLMVFSAILGLAAGSIYAILPDGFGLNTDTLLGFAALAAGAAAAFLVGKKTKVEG